MQPINQVAVIGAGVMGSGIAAQFANAGIPVVLYEQHQQILDRALEGLLSRKPAALMDPSSLGLIQTALVGDWQKLTPCDWVIEVIVEDLEAKRKLYAKLEAHLPSHCLVSSNTSGILWSELTKNCGTEFKRRFAITHFFNPPRYMQLLEFVKGPDTDAETTQRLIDCCEQQLGKTVVIAEDTPGFIANRIGIFSILNGIQLAIKKNIKIEEADAITGRPLGMPKTGVFGLADLIGLDTIALIARNFRTQLAKYDYAQPVLGMPDLMEIMLRKGAIGRKGPGGFYRIIRTEDKKQSETVTETGDYRPTDMESLALAKSLSFNRLLDDAGERGQFVWDFLSGIIVYTLEIADQIANSPGDIDTAMRLGYNWRWGPFELLDKIGVARFAAHLEQQEKPIPKRLRQMLEAGQECCYRQVSEPREMLGFDGEYHAIARSKHQFQLADYKGAGTPVLKTESGALWDLGDGVGCLEFATKLNVLDPGVVELIHQLVDRAPTHLRALVIGGDGAHFSAGADLTFFLDRAHAKLWSEVDDFLAQLQQALAGLRDAPFPVVAAARGLALGGGCELLMHCNSAVAHAELNAGLVEIGVGLIPAGGGLKTLCMNWDSLDQDPLTIFENLIFGQVSGSAQQAKKFAYLKPANPIQMHPQRVLASAKQHALTLANDFKPTSSRSTTFDGVARFNQLSQHADDFYQQGKLTEVDVAIAQSMARVLSADHSQTEVSEAELDRLERYYFLEHLKQPTTQQRIEHMLKTGQRLRN